MRKQKVTRKTTETDITVEVNVDGTGKYDVETGIGFLDHMLEIFSRHGLIDLKVRAKGDLHIDFHHTTEDTGIAIGQALHNALGDRRGIRPFFCRRRGVLWRFCGPQSSLPWQSCWCPLERGGRPEGERC